MAAEPYRTPVGNAVETRPRYTLPSGKVVTVQPLTDDRTGLKARLDRVSAIAALKRLGLKLPSLATIQEISSVGFWVPPVTLVHDATDQRLMRTEAYCRKHDTTMDSRLKLKGWDGKTVVSTYGKWHSAGAAPGANRIAGWPMSKGGTFIQQGVKDVHIGEELTDYATLTMGEVDSDEEPDTQPGGGNVTLRYGDKGPAVAAMQRAIGVTADGHFGPNTLRAVQRFQLAHGLTADGIWGPRSQAAAGLTGAPTPSQSGPKRPDWSPIVGNAARTQRWGHLAFAPAPTAGNPEAITITNSFATDNIVSVAIPQLRGVMGAPASCRVSCHRDVAGPLQALWQAWDKAGLMPLVLSWAGMWAPRFIRGSRTTLSNHAFGTAFDINAPWNGLGREPAPRGAKGSVIDLVPLALEHGWFWGGFYTGRVDGMHLEHSGR